MIAELTNHIWQSTVFAILVGLITLAFHRNRAQVRYWLWLSASLKFLLPFSLLMTFGHRLEWASGSHSIAPTPAVRLAVVQLTQPFPETLPQAPSTRSVHDWTAIAISGSWACGFAALTLLRLRGWQRIRAAVRSSSPIDVLGTMQVRSSPGLLEPGVVGLFHPILLLPTGIAERLQPPQLKAVLAHELCHARRRDNLTSAVHMIVETVFWFHPLVWWIGARLVEERERACDEAVLSLGSEPGDYAEAILRVCKLYVEFPLACVSGISGADMKKRIVRIMTRDMGSELSFGRKLLLVGVGITAVTAPLLLGMSNATKLHAQSSGAESKKTIDARNQGLAGTWQGTLHLGKDRRVVIKISNTDGTPYKAEFFDLDQGGAQTRASSVTSDKGMITIKLAVIAVAYTGTVGSDGNTITGTWVQGSNRVPLVLVRATRSTAWDLPSQAPLPPMMAANATPTLEVATIKPSKPDGAIKRVLLGARIQIRNSNLNDMIVFAYGLHPKQVMGAPAWTETDKFDVEAKPGGEGVPTIDQWRAMVRQLMAERFRLASHREQKDLAVYLLTVSKGGSKLTTSGGDPNGRVGLSFRGRVGGDVSAYNATIADFINFMTRYVQLDRPIVDKTGLAGRYDFTLDWTPDESQFGGKVVPPADGGATAPSLYTAIQEQLGLKLDATKASTDVMVIDHVEKPSEN